MSHPWSSGCGPHHIEGGSSHCLTRQVEGTPLWDSRGGAGCEVHNYWSNYRCEEGEGRRVSEGGEWEKERR